MAAERARVFRRCAVLLGLTLSLASRHAAAEAEPRPGEAWRSVPRIRGTVAVEMHSWVHESHVGIGEQTDSRERAEIRFVLERDSRHGTTSIIWRATQATVVGSVRGGTSFHIIEGYRSNEISADFSGTPPRLREFMLTLDPDTGAWQLVPPDKIRERYTITNVFSGDEPETVSTTSDSIQSVVFDGTVKGPPGPLLGTYEDQGKVGGRSTRGYRKVGRAQFWPEFDDVEVEITIEGYETWRPLGSITKPSTPGSSIAARALLKSKSGDNSDLPEVDRFRFELLDTSREPGVCLNWPLDATDSDYDLQFAKLPGGLAPSGALGTVSEDGLILELSEVSTDDEGRPYADAVVEAFDFGAKAELRVVCVLKDGREIVGMMKTEGGPDLVRLPKRASADWVSEAWRRENDAMALDASDDDEKVDGQQHDGDGFTLYEEYRGWVIGGRHVSGDPKRKDFFVQNRIGPDARPGIRLFEQLSQLRVHDEVRRAEMDATKRLMNGNHRDAPHRVDQHGVWIKTFPSRRELGDAGALTVMLKAGVSGRPGLVSGIGILSRGNTESAFNQPFNLPAQDAIFAYDRAIAHELLHSVGVEHHGSGDYFQILGFVSPRNPSNKVGRPYYGSSVDKPIGLLTEEGHDVAARDYPDYVKFREDLEKHYGEKLRAEGVQFLAAREGYTGMTITTPEQYANQMIELLFVYLSMRISGIVGVEHGEGSGDQDCVMRYYFARFYVAKGFPQRTLYLATPGTERIGLELCRAPTGTGINAPGQKPQPRYGAAAAGAGNCAAQICPNDAIPPRKNP